MTVKATERSPLLGSGRNAARSTSVTTTLGAAESTALVNEVVDERAVANGLDDLHRTTSADDRARQYEGMPEVRRRMPYIFPALAIGVFMSAADQTIIASSFENIGNDLGALNKTSWIATAYFLTLTSFQPLYGKLSDIFSRKGCVLFGYVVFALGCLACGLARNIDELIAARAIAGIGGGALTTVVSIILSDVIPLKDRGAWQGYINIMFASGAAIGAPAGGYLSDQIGWRWAFLVQPPLCVIAFIVVGLVFHMPKEEVTEAWTQKIKRVDFLGAFLLIAAVFSLLFGLDRGSNVSWSVMETLLPLCLSIPLFVAFLLVECKFAAEPFAPGHVILQRSLFACYLCNFFSFAGYMAAYFYIPLYYQAWDGLTATEAGFLLLPQVFASVSGSLFAGFVMRGTGKYYWLTVAAYTAQVCGMAALWLTSGVILNSKAGICIGAAITGFGGGIGVTSVLIGLIANAKRDDQAVATACSYLFRSLGSTVGVSLSSSVVNQELRALLKQHLTGDTAEKVAESVRENFSVIKSLQPAIRDIVRFCYMKAVSTAFGMELVLISGAFFAAWLIREVPLSR